MMSICNIVPDRHHETKSKRKPYMALLRPLDPSFPIERQIAIEAGPVVLVNVVTLDKADEQTFLKTWQDDAAFMKRQPGFISTQLHRALGESPTYLNCAVWESTAHYRAAFGTCSRRSRCPTSASHSLWATVSQTPSTGPIKPERGDNN